MFYTEYLNFLLALLHTEVQEPKESNLYQLMQKK